MERLFPFRAADSAACGGHGGGQPVFGASADGELVQPIEQMTAHLNNVSGVARYPELEPFMDMIEQQHEEILRSANMRVEFTANVSHELKTPLTEHFGLCGID